MGRKTHLMIKNPKFPNVGHCKSYHLVFESYGDYMCDELGHWLLLDVLVIVMNLIMVMEA
jgi:hypothetical protein